MALVVAITAGENLLCIATSSSTSDPFDCPQGETIGLLILYLLPAVVGFLKPRGLLWIAAPIVEGITQVAIELPVSLSHGGDTSFVGLYVIGFVLLILLFFLGRLVRLQLDKRWPR